LQALSLQLIREPVEILKIVGRTAHVRRVSMS
jgi:hypothetical protein